MYTQYEAIYNYARERGSITNREIFEKLYINSPTARISEMRRSGRYRVNDTWDCVDYGNGFRSARFKRYTITRND